MERHPRARIELVRHPQPPCLHGFKLPSACACATACACACATGDGPVILLLGPGDFPRHHNRGVLAGLASFRAQYGSYWNDILAAATVAALPVPALFFAFQRRVVESVKTSGIR
ncbi:hypothetical protein GCM10018793_63090 [Streptomyces sulfonofaciens]|uniref:Uncharacterized protein n=1 Tax=Streptomyces sulfonofaciens TaxID=68272 RepID=A0A919L831_9ACTN|nr:hypothetical protein [Streptomyces sulfonofaciens]GHH87402.1 hypothetical protein GCM10018793_63090 [Streptomyces sulfonofaciens]